MPKSIPVSLVDVGLALHDAQIGLMAQASSSDREQVIYAPAEGSASISKAVQHIAVHINPP